MQAVIGNWKQNPATANDVTLLLEALLETINRDASLDPKNSYCQIMVAPSCIHLYQVADKLKHSPILCSAQDISAHSSTTGAFTGDCSATQIKDSGASFCILGHSERRQYHQESNAMLLNKMQHAMNKALGVILCIGEKEEDHQAGKTLAVLDEQLSIVNDFIQNNPELTDELLDKLIIAYEPVWAIGTGKVPTVDDVTQIHRHIKQTLASFDSRLASISVLYGGSVNADNAADFAKSEMIDGALVGGASLNADSFLAIARAFGRHN